MNLILVEAAEIDSAGEVELTGRRARHLGRVLRAQPGDRLRIGVIRGPVGSGQVLSVNEGRARLRVDIEDDAPEPPTIDLILAVPRPKVLSRILETAAAMGVTCIDLVNAWRVDKSYFQSKRIAEDALRADLVRGCEQGGTTWVPDIAVHRLLMQFLDQLESRLAERGQTARVVAHPRTAALLEDVIEPGSGQRIALAIGPEGGWIDRELESFAALGFTAVSVGPSVLRVETAVAALLAEIALLRRL